ncbi:unnamed protein product [Vicia faba]|uniref:Uncharacterized protein n=1 Tax=Vicia faba TaxID=3906 RepID=A0AAV0ZZB7_VICFA|nr:unnamed protein product [Vicia faba]
MTFGASTELSHYLAVPSVRPNSRYSQCTAGIASPTCLMLNRNREKASNGVGEKKEEAAAREVEGEERRIGSCGSRRRDFEKTKIKYLVEKNERNGNIITTVFHLLAQKRYHTHLLKTPISPPLQPPPSLSLASLRPNRSSAMTFGASTELSHYLAVPSVRPNSRYSQCTAGIASPTCLMLNRNREKASNGVGEKKEEAAAREVEGEERRIGSCGSRRRDFEKTKGHLRPIEFLILNCLQ